MSRALACLALAACWTSTREPAVRSRRACSAQLVGSVHDLDRERRPIAGATIVLSTPDGRVDTEVTDAAGRFTITALDEPAKLTIYHGELVVEHPVAPCQPPIRIGVRGDPVGR